MPKKKLTYQSEKRRKIALEEGREVGITGPPPYLQKAEMQLFKEELQQQTRMGHFLSIREMGMIV
jgi:hypothetical protein